MRRGFRLASGIVPGLFVAAFPRGAEAQAVQSVLTHLHAAVGPEHSYLRDLRRIEYTYATDDEALEAAKFCSRIEGIIPALESAHAVAYVMKKAKRIGKDALVIINLSGRGDKDVSQMARLLKL